MIGAIGSLLLRTQLFAVEVGGQRLPIGPVMVYDMVINSADRGVDRRRAYQRALRVEQIVKNPEIRDLSSLMMIQTARDMIMSRLTGKARTEALTQLDPIVARRGKLTDDVIKYMIVYFLLNYFPVDEIKASLVAMWKRDGDTGG